MQTVCLGLLLFSLTWAAPMVQPQNEKTKQDCVEEQRITYKGHHEKDGYYIFKYVYTSPGRKNQTNVEQEENNKDNIRLHHSGKKRNQEPAPKKTIVQEREKDLFLMGVDKSNQISKSQNLFENRQTMNKAYSISNKENAHNNLKMPIYPESTGNKESEDGNDVLSKLHDQENSGAALTRKNMQHIMEPGAGLELLGEENKEIKPRNILSKIPASGNHAKAPSKGKKNHRRDPQAPQSPLQSKTTHHIRHNTDYLKQSPALKDIPSDFEGSGYLDVQARGDNDLSPFSGDGQPFKDTSGKGEATDPDIEGADIQTEFPGPSEAETINPDAGGPGYNDIPEKAENGRHTVGTRDETAQEANTADVSLVGGSNDITGHTNFRELPGKEGNRVDAGSQNAHQGEVEFHYPHTSSKEKRKESSTDVAENTNDNEISKTGKGSGRKGTEHSDGNQVSSSEKQRFPDTGKSSGQLIPSHGLDNEIKNEIGSHSGPSNEETTPHSGENHYGPHRQNNSMWSKGTPQRKGSWASRKPHSSRRFRPPKEHDSSGSSDSSSSSESDGD
ncbi:matrix extracellular phosphoglycoprotein [Molossus molossus]|uniref:Matrix extracellular phosphoglycoprotein n=1 Tax=Molossus molossus TaxID=27622 RepID=A0A7J8JWY6_MOLMO|nr:matrix extracellular phosphoglycoprotein [Molossus molossus]KAF6501366.1 matrix extracellular phosphoglycoprotein [Molossus molossus]